MQDSTIRLILVHFRFGSLIVEQLHSYISKVINILVWKNKEMWYDFRLDNYPPKLMDVSFIYKQTCIPTGRVRRIKHICDQLKWMILLYYFNRSFQMMISRQVNICDWTNFVYPVTANALLVKKTCVIGIHIIVYYY